MRRAISLFFIALVVPAAIASDSGIKDSYILRDGDITYMLGEGMSAAALKQIQQGHGREFFWARRNGRTFVSHDEEVIDQVRLIVQRNVRDRSEQERRLAAIADRVFRQRRLHQ